MRQQEPKDLEGPISGKDGKTKIQPNERHDLQVQMTGTKYAIRADPGLLNVFTNAVRQADE